MHEAMHQALVLRHEVGSRQIVIVGSDQGIQLRVVGESFRYPLQGVGLKTNIDVDEKENCALGGRGGEVAGICRSPASGNGDDRLALFAAFSTDTSQEPSSATRHSKSR